jgi:spore maturation protein B
MMNLIADLSKLLIPIFILGTVIYGFARKVPVYDSFIKGAKDGFGVILNIFPYLLAIFVAIKSFQASGALEILGRASGKALSAIGISPDLLSLFIVKPLSGSASLGIFSDIVKNNGPESISSLIAAVIVGSAETTFYVLAIYLGAVGIKKTKYLVPVCLTADIIGMVVAVVVVRMLF